MANVSKNGVQGLWDLVLSAIGELDLSDSFRFGWRGGVRAVGLAAIKFLFWEAEFDVG